MHTHTSLPTTTKSTDLRFYTAQRLAATFIPIAHLQRAPYCGSIQPLLIHTRDSVDIAATLFPRGQPDIVIICHGFGASQRSASIVWLAEVIAGPWDVLTFDWRGYGQSGGLASMGGTEAFDLEAVLRTVATMGYQRIGVIGESMGGLITLAMLGMMTSADCPMPDRVVTLGAPADYALTGGMRPQLIQYVAHREWVRPFAPLLGFRLGPLNIVRPLDVVNRIQQPLMFIHGEHDTTVPVQNAYELYAQAPHATLRIYTGVDHGVQAMRARAPQQLIEDIFAHFNPMRSPLMQLDDQNWY